MVAENAEQENFLLTGATVVANFALATFKNKYLEMIQKIIAYTTKEWTNDFLILGELWRHHVFRKLLYVYGVSYTRIRARTA